MHAYAGPCMLWSAAYTPLCPQRRFSHKRRCRLALGVRLRAAPLSVLGPTCTFHLLVYLCAALCIYTIITSAHPCYRYTALFVCVCNAALQTYIYILYALSLVYSTIIAFNAHIVRGPSTVLLSDVRFFFFFLFVCVSGYRLKMFERQLLL